MPHRCVVPGCGNILEQSNATGISFFHFPSDQTLKAQWINNLGLAAVTSTSRVCHLHFSSSQYSAKVVRKLVSGGTPNLISTASGHNKENVSPGVSCPKSFTSVGVQADIPSSTITVSQSNNCFQGSGFFKHFMAMQVARSASATASFYSDIEKTIALSIYYSGGSSNYECWRKWGAKLPSSSTIRRWIGTLDLKPGRNQLLLDCLAEKVPSMHPIEKDCILSLDETSLYKCISYNKATDEIEGFQDFGEKVSGDKDREMLPADYASVVMVRGLTTDWRMPIRFDFSGHNTTSKRLHNIVNTCIVDLFAIGLKVRAVVCDQGGCNQGMFKLFKIDIDAPFARISGNKVYFMFDAPHIIKNIRNNLLKTDYALIDKPQDRISMDHIKNFYDVDTAAPFRSDTKLTDRHLQPSNMEKMKVKLATQLFSKSVADGMKTLIELGQLDKSHTATAEFCKQVDTIFDLMNISREHSPKKPWKSGKLVFENIHMWKESKEWVGKICLACSADDDDDDASTSKRPKLSLESQKEIDWLRSQKPTLPCLRALQHSLQAQYLLIQDLQKEGYKYVLTRRLQSDCVEHLFSFLKHKLGAQEKPTVPTFRCAMRFCVISNMIKTPEGSNCEHYDSEDGIFETQRKLAFLLKNIKRKSAESVTADMSDSEDEFESSAEEDSNDDDGTFNRNPYFAALNDLQNCRGSENAAVYTGTCATKKIISKNGCSDCKEALLQFLSDKPDNNLDDSELLTLNKSFDNTALDRNVDLGFGHLSSSLSIKVFVKLSEILASCTANSFNLVCTNVVRNIRKEICKDSVISDWISDTNIPNKCKAHRLDIINFIIRAKLYLWIKEFNCKLKMSNQRKIPKF